MIRSPTVRVKPNVLFWARTTMSRQVRDVAKRLNISEKLVRKWECGEKNPTLNQLKNLSTYYKRPLAAFFLPKPPEELPPPRDFRNIPAGTDRSLSLGTILAIRRARRLQSIMQELPSVQADIAPLPKHIVGDDPEKVAGNIRELLGISKQEQGEFISDSLALNRYKEVVEILGILVLQLPIEISDARAFSLTDGGRSVIVMNKRDSPGRRIFSLFHELAHILLDEGGMCDMRMESITDEKGVSITEQQGVEAFCNRFAEAILKHKEVQGRHEEFTLLQKGRRRRQNRPRKCIDECGVPFITTVLNSYKEDRITYSDVSDYLEIPVKYIPEVERLIEARS